jgi:hypothetical protein
MALSFHSLSGTTAGVEQSEMKIMAQERNGLPLGIVRGRNSLKNSGSSSS